MSRILDRIENTADLRRLDETELTQLCQEIREEIINTVSQTGGHLGSNLGVVELTIAILLEFDCPLDQVVFDVGHQCYTWKLLTGRKDKFASLRQAGGLSGFPKTTESEFDCFNTGHSSTSISAAIGMARANRLRGIDQKVIAIIGDGALTGGMSFEALNDLSQQRENVLIIINDNQMSIDHNVGGLARHLDQMRATPRYNEMKTNWILRLRKLPVFGKIFLKITRGIKRWLRRNLFKDRGIFEKLGLKYFGPVNGHNLTELRKYFHNIKRLKRPTILHCTTIKGYGYHFAENTPEKYHGVSPFEIEKGVCSNGVCKPTYSALIGDNMCKLAAEDKTVVAITAAMMQGTGLTKFAKQYPDRFFDVGIAEQHAVTLAAGMARGGLKPFVAIYSTFAQRAMDQIIHDVCLQNLPVTFLIDRAGAVSADGDTHQGYYDMAFLSSLPHISLFSPVTEKDLECIMSYAKSADKPVAIRYPRSTVVECGDKLADLNADNLLSVRRVVENEGKLVVIAIGVLVEKCLEAYEQLTEEQKQKVSILNLVNLTLSEDQIRELHSLILAADQTLILEDGAIDGGIGQQLQYALRDLDCSWEILGLTDLTADQASRDQLLEAAGLNTDNIRKKLEGAIAGA